MIKQFRFFSVALLIAAISVSVSCKKVVDNPGDGGQSGTTDSKLLYDSLYLYAKEFYLWNNQLPADLGALNPSQYYNTDDSTGLDNELFGLVKDVKDKDKGFYYEYVTDSKFPKYSYLVKTLSEINGGGVAIANNQLRASTTLNDSKGDGIGLFLSTGYIPGTEDDMGWFVWYVNTGSPAYKAGLRRGQFVAKINNKTYSTSNNDLHAIDALLMGREIDITIKDLETDKETSFALKADPAYDWNPILKDTILKANGESVGYIAYQAFADPVTSGKYLRESFKEFADADVKKMIVDLRYNYGGFVATSELFANLLIPSGNNGSVLFKEHYNSNLNKKDGRYSAMTTALLKSQKIYKSDEITPTGGTYLDYAFDSVRNTFEVSKQGSLNGLSKIVFIVSDETASASELLINSLVPYLDVKLVGVYNSKEEYDKNQVRTYGKPVGFFPIRIGEFTLYTPNFYTTNSDNFSDYYQGFLTDKNGFDDVTADFAAATNSSSAFIVAMKELVPGYNPIASISSARRKMNSNVNRAFNIKRKKAGLRESPVKGIMIDKPRSIKPSLN